MVAVAVQGCNICPGIVEDLLSDSEMFAESLFSFQFGTNLQ